MLLTVAKPGVTFCEPVVWAAIRASARPGLVVRLGPEAVLYQRNIAANFVGLCFYSCLARFLRPLRIITAM